MEVGNLIQKAVFKTEMNQREFAQKIGRSPQLVSDWINNRRVPNADEFLKIILISGIIEEVFEYLKEKEGSFPESIKTIDKRNKEIEELKERISRLEDISLKKEIKNHGLNIVGNGNKKNSMNIKK